jgi:hypothetical protein
MNMVAPVREMSVDTQAILMARTGGYVHLEEIGRPNEVRIIYIMSNAIRSATSLLRAISAWFSTPTSYWGLLRHHRGAFSKSIEKVQIDVTSFPGIIMVILLSTTFDLHPGHCMRPSCL